jgi:peptidoglycan/xylan/chitin deacetylase (PgdA/CDA1 family)
MTAWLVPVARALDSASAPVTVFFRDDDVGWGTSALLALLDVFDRHAVPVDLAVIPQALTSELARDLRGREVHQHGYAHVNHQVQGRKCEFGSSRTRQQQRSDMQAGRDKLLSLIGDAVRPIFTPPWNRCTAETAECLRDLGFRVLSRDVSAGLVGLPGLVELPITFDWFAKRLNSLQLGELLAQQIASGQTVGIMLHHAVMDSDDFAMLGELLELFAGHPRVQARQMLALLNAGT